MTGTAGRAFLDIVLQLVLVLLIIPHLPTPDDDARPPGNMSVEIRWEDGLSTDVDLWVKAPDDRPVGYSRKAGSTFNLVRDDLGTVQDPLSLNYENCYSRGVPAGEYVVNLHLYSNNAAVSEITVVWVVEIKNRGPRVLIATGTATLRFVGEEITVVRFTLDEDGRLVAGSIHDTPIPLRAR